MLATGLSYVCYHFGFAVLQRRYKRDPKSIDWVPILQVKCSASHMPIASVLITLSPIAYYIRAPCLLSLSLRMLQFSGSLS